MTWSDLDLATALARGAAELAATHFRTGLAIEYKTHPGDVVSAADVEAEAWIRTVLQQERPDDGMLGEEGTATAGDRRWLVDAVDGTLNFLRGDPFWCTAVALQDAAGTVVSAVHHVAGGETFTAARGQGCRLNGKLFRRDGEVPLTHAVLSTYLHPGDGHRPAFQRLLKAVASSRIRGSGSLELAWFAAGRVDVWVQRDVLPWDLAPGSLLAREAGGITGSVEVEDGIWSFACDGCSEEQLRDLLGAHRDLDSGLRIKGGSLKAMSESARLLVRARSEAGMTQRELARRTGVPQPLISAYEKGRRQPGADMLLRLLRGTGHRVDLQSTVEAGREAAAKLEQVCAMAMALPVRDRGPLTFPAWRTLTDRP